MPSLLRLPSRSRGSARKLFRNLSRLATCSLALTLTACASSVVSGSKAPLDLPPLPANVATGGNVTAWPKEIDDSNLLALQTQIRRNELRQARAVKACQLHDAKLRSLYYEESKK